MQAKRDKDKALGFNLLPAPSSSADGSAAAAAPAAPAPESPIVKLCNTIHHKLLAFYDQALYQQLVRLDVTPTVYSLYVCVCAVALALLHAAYCSALLCSSLLCTSRLM